MVMPAACQTHPHKSHFLRQANCSVLALPKTAERRFFNRLCFAGIQAIGGAGCGPQSGVPPAVSNFDETTVHFRSNLLGVLTFAF
jgi:hypothetical protein